MARHIPPKGTKQRKVLEALLQGERVDPFYALMELNLSTLNARVSELRRMGWPVRSLPVPHPKLENEKVHQFFLDSHFRRWILESPDRHPGEYPHSEGRGKFEGWAPDDYKRGGKK